MDPAIIWFIVGAILVLSEFVLPGIILVFFGVAAWIVALLAWLGIVESLAVQLIVFTVLSLALLLGLRRICMRSFMGQTTDSASGEDAMNEFVGKDAAVLEAFESAGSQGKVEFKGASWNAVSDCPLAAGDTAVIVNRDGLKLNITKKG